MSSRPAPLVSVIMANRNGAAYLAEAVRSVLRQTLSDLELVVVDDASDDRSVEIVNGFQAQDRRVVLLERSAPSGPAAARNAGLDVATGRWIAVVDSDDYIHPDRFRRLLALAQAEQADIVADDQVVFHEHGAEPARLFFKGAMARKAGRVSAEGFIRTDTLYGRVPPLGYLKPVIRRDALVAHGARYDERLFNGEDFNLIARLLIGGARMLTTPEPLYFYRRRAGSTSHRLSPDHLRAIVDTDADLRRQAGDRRSILRALDARMASQRTVYAFEGFAHAVKGRRLATAAAVMARRPQILGLGVVRLAQRFGRLARGRAAPPPRRDAKELLVLSRQRVAGATNGSSAYLLSLAGAFRRRGWRVRFVGASPGVFGRRPFFRLQSELAVFDDYAVRGGRRVGDWMVTSDPRVWLRGFAAAVEQKLCKTGLLRAPRLMSAPYSVSLPARREDLLFVARRAAGRADAVLADYAFLTPLIPYALAPNAPSAVVMHDLFSSRPAQFDRSGGKDSVARLAPIDEFRLLGQADAVVAIQREEAEAVAKRLPGAPVFVAPMAVEPRSAPQPGQAPELLFVGSNAAPNVLGLTWFLQEVWPRLLCFRPDARLTVAGDVNRAFASGPVGVRFLGLVPDLEPLYARAAVVVAPLTAGSGLKIKLVEALSRGKAIVATSVTAQGVEELVRPAVAVADDPAEFAAETALLLDDDDLRERRGAEALAVVAAHFGEARCYADVVRFLAGETAEAEADPARGLRVGGR